MPLFSAALPLSGAMRNDTKSRVSINSDLIALPL